MTIRDDILPDLDEARAELDVIGFRMTGVVLRLATYPTDIADGSVSVDTDVVLSPTPKVVKLSDERASWMGGNPAGVAAGRALLSTYNVGPITPPWIRLTSPVVQTGPGAGTIGISGGQGVLAPDSASIVLQILTSGTVGDIVPPTYRLSADGGATWISTNPCLPIILDGPLGLAFSGAFVAGTTYAFNATWGGWDLAAWVSKNVDTRHRRLVVLTGRDYAGGSEVCTIVRIDQTKAMRNMMTVQRAAQVP